MKSKRIWSIDYKHVYEIITNYILKRKPIYVCFTVNINIPICVYNFGNKQLNLLILPENV